MEWEIAAHRDGIEPACHGILNLLADRHGLAM
jgi:hypothetical protein